MRLPVVKRYQRGFDAARKIISIFSSLLLVAPLLSLIAVTSSATAANAVSANPTPVCSGANCIVTFSYTGDYYAWTVPGGVTSVTFDVQGAQGGTTTELYSPQAGGLGGRVTGDLSTTPGQILYLYVGGRPAANSSSGGWNGGGAPGLSTAGSGGQGGYSGGGGGGSDIRTSTALANRVVVAGGGGGAGRDYVNGSCTPCGIGGTGGAGGGTSGASGGNATNGYTPGAGGSGGTSSAGGAAGVSSISGTSGSLAVGGNGSAGTQDVSGGGGGG